MQNKYLISYLLVLFGELILILSFSHFGNKKDIDILYLNIVVSTIIYLLFFRGTISAWMGLSTNYENRIGSLGVIWFFVFLYSVLAISIMIYSNALENDSFGNQLIYQSIVFFLLLLGFFLSGRVNEKENSVSGIVAQNKYYINRINKIAILIDNKLSTRSDIDITSTPFHNLHTLTDNIKYLYPNNVLSEINSEISLINNLDNILEMLNNPIIDNSSLSILVNRSHVLYVEIKNTYSV
jgi:hypothetical protein